MSNKRRLSKAPSMNEPVSKKRKLAQVPNESDGEEECEDDDGYLLTSKLDYDIQTGLHALRNDDSSIYDSNHNFVEHKENKENTQDSDVNDNEYPWIKQLNDSEQDTFLQKFFSQKLWRCKNDELLSTIGVHRGYKGTKHDDDDIDLSDDDRNVLKQNDFEREWREKQKHSLQNNEILTKQQNNIYNKNKSTKELETQMWETEKETCKILDFLED